MNNYRIIIEIITPVMFTMDVPSQESAKNLIEKLCDSNSEYYDQFWQYLYDCIHIKSIAIPVDD
ncbi:MAG: hypothetical protein HY741_01335 [Chloroflexi bacterium]|nr:hypothetical protein [Chloroflexota bacterium]